MRDLLTAAQMRAAEAVAISEGGVDGRALMERAGAGAVAAAQAFWPHLAPAGRAVVLCGPGNNGGDGYVIARLLREAGWRVAVYFLGDPERLPPDARANFALWAESGAVAPLAEAAALSEAPDLIVDALFGTGLGRDLDAGVDAVLAALTQMRQKHAVAVVAVDVPSGLCSDSGRLRGAVLRCGLTVTFHAAKLGHYLAQGPDVCGAVRVVDIGLGARGEEADIAQVWEAQDVAPWVLKGEGHKYDHGHAFVVCGGAGKGGAARLAARAALRIGAGLVTLGPPPEALAENAARLDAVMLEPVADAAALTTVLGDGRIGALCLGPGLGLGRARELVTVAIAGAGPRRRVILDADALTAFAETPEALFARLSPDCVLTPHFGEFQRLFPDLAARLSAPPYSKADAVRDAAARAGCVVLLKGRDTVIADPTGRCAVNAAAYHRATPWLATAGAGDVLSGLICGLLARGVPPFEAAAAAAWVHVEAARSFGAGLIAEDLPEQVPAVLRALDA